MFPPRYLITWWEQNAACPKPFGVLQSGFDNERLLSLLSLRLLGTPQAIANPDMQPGTGNRVNGIGHEL